MKRLKIFFFLFLVTAACNNDDRYYGEIVETNEKGEILNDREDQWIPRMSFSEINNSNLNERESWPVLSLYPIYPNPLTSESTLCFRLKRVSKFGIILYDEMHGKRDTLYYSRAAAGTHCWNWRGYNYKYNARVSDSLSNGNYQLNFFTISEGENFESHGNIKINR